MWNRSSSKLLGAQRRMLSSFEIEPRVQRALSNGEPVVALESTIVAHGMPYPQNLQVAQEVESILREKVGTVAPSLSC